jgi:cytidylate kinase
LAGKVAGVPTPNAIPPNTLPTVIAIDGPVASGKTAVGRELARRLSYRFIDTGLMYRACTYLALREGVGVDDGPALERLATSARMDIVLAADGATTAGERLEVDGEDVTDALRTPEVEANVSTVAAVPGVRVALVAQQQRMAEEGRVVMVGRDIGTKVLPNAAKVYLDASPDERVRRRLAEVAGKQTEAEVRANLELRDRLDSEREASPLEVAEGAAVVMTDDLDVAGVAEAVIGVLSGAGR